jgi:hypothetical protein
VASPISVTGSLQKFADVSRNRLLTRAALMAARPWERFHSEYVVVFLK